MGATSAGTKHYFKSRALGMSPQTFGKTGWTVSPVGFGSYRIEGDVPEQDQALRDALLGGCNLIDTSTNYGDGESERTVGRVVRELISQGRLLREEVVIVSKAGYLQGKNYVQAQARETEGRAFPEMVKLRPGLWHCLHPEFLKVQLDASLERLGLETLDVLLLHNPEYYLKSSGAQPAEYYRRIQAALEYLETERKAGRIQAFGISSNTFGEPKDSNEFTSLEVILETAPPGFQVIQFPFNLLEPGAVFEPNNSGKTLVELAFERELATLVNRPLNAFWNHRLVR
jgi:aryl-alcohol dehydrogenase-like predicted oxidoreductase